MPPTQEIIDSATMFVLSHEVARLDFAFYKLWDTAPRERVKQCLKDIETEKKKCMKKLKELFPSDIKQKGVFIDDVLNKNRFTLQNPFDE